MSKGICWGFASLVLVFAMVLTPHQAAAVNIVMNFDTGSTDHPSFDSDGSKLITMMAAVESYYQAIFEDSGTLTVTYLYDDLEGSTLASTLTTGIDSNGHPTECTIWVDTGTTWYFDPTPTEDSEFNMVQQLVRDVGTSKYSGSVPNLLEYRYKGSRNNTDPSSTGMDMWSTLIHEMGHGMGMNGLTAWSEVLFDSEYDISSSLVWGNTMAIDCYDGDDYHLAATCAMYPYSSSGQRDSLSATDLFAIASGGNWSGTLDLFRQDFYSTASNANLNTAGNWEGNKVPDSADDAWIRDGGTAALTAALSCDDLVISGATTVTTGAYKLLADQNCTLGDSSGIGAVVISNTGELQVDKKLTINDGSSVTMSTGSMLDVDDLLVNVGSSITGAGTIDIETSMTLNGTLTVSGGDLAITSLVTVNLDGASPNDGQGKVYVTGGNFSCNKALTDNFTGTIQVDSSRTATFSEGWRILTGGTLNMNGGTSSSTRAKIAGGLFKVAGPVNIDKQGEFACDSEIESSAVITLTDSDDNLYVSSGAKTTIFSGATFTGAGRLYGLVGSTIALDNNAVIDVRLRAHGVLTVEEGGIGTATVNAAFALDSTSEMIMEASDNGVCDLLDSNTSTTYLRGLLTFDFLNGYVPDQGDSFTIITYDIRNGTFAQIDYDGNFNLVADYGATALTLTVAYVPGDANKDGVVDGSDATILAGYWQQGSATWEMGDFNDDHVVDGSDATILAGYWQQSVGDSATAVPEPSMIVTLLTLLLSAGFIARRF